jgi:hypothetical protein
MRTYLYDNESEAMNTQMIQQQICAVICSHNGIKARDIAKELELSHETVNRVLYTSPLMKELCWQDQEYRWHGIIRQEIPHLGLQEFAGYYSTVKKFLSMDEETWLKELCEGCRNIGRNLNDTRGLFHSFRDSREQLHHLFQDLMEMECGDCLDWEIAFELRLKRSRYVRIYADVLVITDRYIFALEFKMKDRIDPDEIRQSAKYAPYLEIVFGSDYQVVPVLVLTAAHDLFQYAETGRTINKVHVCSGDMLFNAFNDHIGFLLQ